MRFRILGFALACAMLLGSGVATAQRVKAGESETAAIERVATAQEVSEVVRHDSATWIKLHFANITLQPGGYLRVVGGPDQAQVQEFTASATDLWANSVEGSSVTIEAKGAAYSIDEYGRGMASPQEIVQGADNRQNRECFAGEYKYFDSAPVGRMLFKECTQAGCGTSWFYCTGWVASDTSLFMTNNHCVNDSYDMPTLEVKMPYHETTCGGTTLATHSTFNGGTFRKTNANLDYTLLTLNGSPAATYGYLAIRGHNLATGQLLWLPQHGGGRPTEITDTDCYVIDPAWSEPGYNAGSSIKHYCDTEGGSSGSPVLDMNNEVVALHHTGYTGYNGALLMSKIWPEIAVYFPTTQSGSHSGSVGTWYWYRSASEAWRYVSGNQQRLWAYLQSSSDYVWVDSVRQKALAEMIEKSAASGHYIGIWWNSTSAWTNARLWYY